MTIWLLWMFVWYRRMMSLSLMWYIGMDQRFVMSMFVMPFLVLQWRVLVESHLMHVVRRNTTVSYMLCMGVLMPAMLAWMTKFRVEGMLVMTSCWKSIISRHLHQAFLSRR